MTGQYTSRYSRQVLFAGIGEEGQRRLEAARVLLVGCGGLGTVIADILVRAGIGCVRIVDRDIVEESNLQRQVLFDSADADEGLPKAEAARRKLTAINPHVEIDAHVADFDAANARDLVSGVDVILDGTDNFEARYLINDLSVATQTPWVYGAVVGSNGMSATIVPGHTPCLCCLYESAPPHGSSGSCDTAGIIAPIAHMIASIQAAEAMKILVKGGDAVRGRLVTIDVWQNEFRQFSTDAARDPDCPTCGKREFTWLDADVGSYAVSLCGRNAVQVHVREQRPVDFQRLSETLNPLGHVSFTRFVFKFRCAEADMTIFPDGRAIIEGTDDTGRARELYARYVGH